MANDEKKKRNLETEKVGKVVSNKMEDSITDSRSTKDYDLTDGQKARALREGALHIVYFARNKLMAFIDG